MDEKNKLSDIKENKEKDISEIEDVLKKLESRREAVLDLESKRQKLNSIITWITLITGLVGVFYYFSAFVFKTDNFSNDRTKLIAINKTLDSLLLQFDTTKHLRITHIDTARLGISDKTIILKLDKLNNDLTSLNNIILDNPEKALSLPLVKKDLEQLKLKTDTDITRIYDLLKWIGGLIFTLLLSLLSLAFTNIFFKKKDNNELDNKKYLDEILEKLNDYKK